MSDYTELELGIGLHIWITTRPEFVPSSFGLESVGPTQPALYLL